MITVFFDGRCGLCRREIAYYQRIAPKEVFDWQDITRKPEGFVQRGYAVKAGLKALHVEDEDRQMHRGVAAFMVIWKHLPGYWAYLAHALKIPFMLPLAEKCYTSFAAWRYRHLGYDQCDL